MTPTAPGPRQRLLAGAITLVREHGVEGTGLTELLARTGTARNSIYQHFPGGKADLIEASTLAAGEWVRENLAAAGAVGEPAEVIALIVEGMKASLAREDYRYGCPIVAAAVAGSDNPKARAAAATVFASWQAELGAAFERAGVAEPTARSLAGFAISAIEGALIQARAAGSVEPLDDASRHLSTLACGYSSAG